MSYITVIGAGSWGTTLACLLADKSYDVTLWAYEKDIVDEINEQRTNKTYIPDAIIPDNLKATNNLEEALKKARFIINAVPAQFTRSVFKELTPS